jgi:hypothetical protein
VRDTCLDDFVRGQLVEPLPVKRDRSLARVQQAGDRLERRRLTCAVRSQDSDFLAPRRTDAPQRLDVFVKRPDRTSSSIGLVLVDWPDQHAFAKIAAITTDRGRLRRVPFPAILTP